MSTEQSIWELPLHLAGAYGLVLRRQGGDGRQLTPAEDLALDALLVAEAPYTAYTQIIGLTQHDLYHAGQIALLKRALTAPSHEFTEPRE